MYMFLLNKLLFASGSFTLTHSCVFLFSFCEWLQTVSSAVAFRQNVTSKQIACHYITVSPHSSASKVTLKLCMDHLAVFATYIPTRIFCITHGIFRPYSDRLLGKFRQNKLSVHWIQTTTVFSGSFKLIYSLLFAWISNRTGTGTNVSVKYSTCKMPHISLSSHVLGCIKHFKENCNALISATFWSSISWGKFANAFFVLVSEST